MGQFRKFAIRPLEKNIRPGDDILLRFELDFKSHIKYATAEEQDFLAVYDKKMLWRANLYIDEGVNDWNNIHPWNAPPVIADAITYGQAFDEKGKVTRQFLKSDSNILYTHWIRRNRYVYTETQQAEVAEIRKRIKPFRPGVDPGMNSTGVDSEGLLTGSIAMTSMYKDILDPESV